MFGGRRILLGVTGSIAAYKAVLLLRRLTGLGADVHVVMTKAAMRFVTPLTFQVLSGHSVYDDVFDLRDEILHLTLVREADAVVVAPATANSVAKLAAGLADDLLSTLVLAARCPIVIAPAMDAVMWENRMVQRNLDVLRASGMTIVEPEHGPLASGVVGPGRLASEDVIVSAVRTFLEAAGSWVGERVLVTAGPTSEAIDPVRAITNRSSGKMGYALAEAATRRGADVTLISGPTCLAPPIGATVVPVTTAEAMRNAVLDRVDSATVLIMAAAVADYRPRSVKTAKIKKRAEPLTIELVQTEDILGAVTSRPRDAFIVGFAAETEHVVERATEKLKSKDLDLIVANDVSLPDTGIGSDFNEVVLLDRHGGVNHIEKLPKREVAERILSHIEWLRSDQPPSKRRVTRQ